MRATNDAVTCSKLTISKLPLRPPTHHHRSTPYAENVAVAVTLIESDTAFPLVIVTKKAQQLESSSQTGQATMRLTPLTLTAVVMAALLPAACLAFTTTSATSPSLYSSVSRLYNVPPPSADDPVALKTYSDREKPPASFYELQINCARAAKLAMDDGHKLLEIEVCLVVECGCIVCCIMDVVRCA